MRDMYCSYFFWCLKFSLQVKYAVSPIYFCGEWSAKCSREHIAKRTSIQSANRNLLYNCYYFLAFPFFLMWRGRRSSFNFSPDN